MNIIYLYGKKNYKMRKYNECNSPSPWYNITQKGERAINPISARKVYGALSQILCKYYWFAPDH